MKSTVLVLLAALALTACVKKVSEKDANDDKLRAEIAEKKHQILQVEVETASYKLLGAQLDRDIAKAEFTNKLTDSIPEYKGCEKRMPFGYSVPYPCATQRETEDKLKDELERLIRKEKNAKNG